MKLNILALIIFIPAASFADDMPVSVNLSSLGVIVDTTRPISEKVDLRIEASQSVLWWSDLASAATRGSCIYCGPWGNRYIIKQQTLGPIVDWYPVEWPPLEGHFRTSVGLLLNNNNTEVEGLSRYEAANVLIINDTYRINGNEYSTSQIGRPHGKFSYKRYAPYLGIGWGNTHHTKPKKWTFTADVGLLFQGKPTLTYTATGNVPGLQADLEAERISILNKEPSWWPVISGGLVYIW